MASLKTIGINNLKQIGKGESKMSDEYRRAKTENIQISACGLGGIGGGIVAAIILGILYTKGIIPETSIHQPVWLNLVGYATFWAMSGFCAGALIFARHPVLNEINLVPFLVGAFGLLSFVVLTAIIVAYCILWLVITILRGVLKLGRIVFKFLFYPRFFLLSFQTFVR